MFDFISPAFLATAGAGYAAVQAVAFFLSLFIPAHTIVGKATRAITKWPAQLIPTPNPPVK